jgi:hypothetical protein
VSRIINTEELYAIAEMYRPAGYGVRIERDCLSDQINVRVFVNRTYVHSSALTPTQLANSDDSGVSKLLKEAFDTLETKMKLVDRELERILK